MEAEAAPLIAHLGLTLQKDAIPPPAPCTVYSGAQDGAQVHVVVNGKCATHGVDSVGTVPAAVTAYLALQTFRPDLIVSAGTAGGFGSQGARIGDIFVSTATINHDRRIPLGVREGFYDFLKEVEGGLGGRVAWRRSAALRWLHPHDADAGSAQAC